jgi:hypothetical protein
MGSLEKVSNLDPNAGEGLGKEWVGLMGYGWTIGEQRVGETGRPGREYQQQMMNETDIQNRLSRN